MQHNGGRSELRRQSRHTTSLLMLTGNLCTKVKPYIIVTLHTTELPRESLFKDCALSTLGGKTPPTAWDAVEVGEDSSVAPGIAEPTDT